MRDQILTGLRRGEFHVVYQPQVCAEGLRVEVVEALLRWTRPGLGPIGPAHFVPIAERCGTIRELGEFVLGQACADSREWRDMRVAVNVASVQLDDPDFPDRVATVIKAGGLPAERLELEIVETTRIKDFDRAARAIARLRRFGARVALDDFGSGYSNLSYLQRLPVDKLKIDRAFVSTIATPQSQAVIAAIVSMGRSLGLTVTAEGIETEDQSRELRRFGCESFQGYLFSAPVSAAEISRMLEAEQAAVI